LFCEPLKNKEAFLRADAVGVSYLRNRFLLVTGY